MEDIEGMTGPSYAPDTRIAAAHVLELRRIADVLERLLELVESQMIHVNIQ